MGMVVGMGMGVGCIGKWVLIGNGMGVAIGNEKAQKNTRANLVKANFTNIQEKKIILIPNYYYINAKFIFKAQLY